MEDNPFVGTWRLVSAEFRRADGAVLHLYGRDPVGMLVYDVQGHMIGQIMRRDRPALPASKQVANALEDYQAIIKGSVAYFGTYEVDFVAGTITHHVQGSLIPDWVGIGQVRLFAFAGERLTLRTPSTPLHGTTLEGVLIWERTDR
jgi:Lipocalin-like domain